jgi:hypothetical protein
MVAVSVCVEVAEAEGRAERLREGEPEAVEVDDREALAEGVAGEEGESRGEGTSSDAEGVVE